MKKIYLAFILAIICLTACLLTGKVNAQNCFWAKSASGSGDEYTQAIATDISGNVYVTGGFAYSLTIGDTTLTCASGNGEFFIVKYSPGGSVIWARGTANGAGYGLTTDTAGNVYATGFFVKSIIFGSTTLTDSGAGDNFVVKYDPNGNVVWAKFMGGRNGGETVNSITVDKGENVFIAGSFENDTITFGNFTISALGTGNLDIFVAKFNSVGNPVWLKGAGGDRPDNGNSITENNGYLYITGSFASDSIPFGDTTFYNVAPGADVFYNAKMDTSGNFIWTRAVNSTWGNADGYGIASDSAGNTFITGTFTGVTTVFGATTFTQISSGSTSIFIVKYDVSGNVLWAKSSGSNNYTNKSFGIAIDTSSNVYITGYYNSPSISFDSDTLKNNSSLGANIFIAKYGSVGNVIWAKSAGGTGDEFARGIAKGVKDNVYITGDFEDNAAVFGNDTLISLSNDDIFVADLYNFNSAISSFTDATCYGSNNGAAFTSASEGNAPYTYFWNTTPTQTTPSVTNLPAGNFTVTITEAYGCAQTYSVTITQPSADSAKICMVTVDSLSEYNVIVWDKTPFTRVDSFIVYREITTNNYQPIARIPFAALSQFTDTVRTLYFPNTGNPNAGTYRYKLQLHDTCGSYSALSPYHNTIYIQNNDGTFFWTQPYSIENDTNPVSDYILMRDDSSNGNWQAVNSVAGTQQTVSDPLYSIYKDIASWRVKTQWGISCAPTFTEMATAFSTSFSNVMSNLSPVGIENNSLANVVNIYPNPANDNLTIETSQHAIIDITNIQGQLMKTFATTGNNTNVDVSCFPSGVYILKAEMEKGIIVRKFVKE